MTDREQDGWIPAKVGCYWTRDGYTIGTIAMGDNSKSGYTLTRNRVQLAEFVTWEQAVAMADADPRCELCGESAGEGGAVCPACVANHGLGKGR